MKQTSTFRKLFVLIFLLTGITGVSYAQQATTIKNQPATYQLMEANPNQTGIDAKGSSYTNGDGNDKNEEQPVYYNYKGLTNLEEARMAWLKDNTQPAATQPAVPASGAKKPE